MDIFKKCYIPSLKDEAKERNIYPYFHALESRQDTEVIMEGKRRIMLGSNNYLGLTTCPEVIEAGVEALKTLGSGCSGSRFLNGTLKLHLELEAELADFLGTEDAMTFSTGFQSNLGIISAIARLGDYILCDNENHASIYDACKLSYAKTFTFKHGDMADLERQLKILSEKSGGILIVTDGVFSMSGDIADLKSICRLAKEYGARVMVDDAHGLGVLGDGGRGTAHYFGVEKEVDIFMGTFSKSLASLGGYMAAKHDVVDYVRHASRPFIFSASIPPASAACALAALRHLRAHPELPKRLMSLSNHLRSALTQKGVKIISSNTPVVPIYTYEVIETLEAAKEIYDRGVYLNPALPPATPEHGALLRTSCMATHTEALLDEAADIIASVINERISAPKI